MVEKMWIVKTVKIYSKNQESSKAREQTNYEIAKR